MTEGGQRSGHPKFEPGRIVATATCAGEISPEVIQAALARHLAGDWGDIGAEDSRQNELDLRRGGRLLSRYRDQNGEAFWIITEADRSSTCILRPSEY